MPTAKLKLLNQKGVAPILFLLIAAVGLIGFVLASSSVEFKNKLFSSLYPKPPSYASGQCIQVDSLPISVPVLVLEYYPRDPSNNELLDGNETGWKQDASINGRTISFWEQKTQQMINQGITVINESTKYRGYKDSQSPQFLNYQVLDQKKFYTPMPRGHLLEEKAAGNAIRPDYGKILRDLNICDYIDKRGVKEVWIYGYHNDNGIVPDESKMSSKYGDISNALPKDQSIEEQYRMPICNNSYVMYNFTYQPTGDPGNNLHNRGHQIENIIPFAEGETRWPPTVANSEGSIFWGDFSEYVQNDSPFVTQDGNRVSSYKSSCGNIHLVPNWTNTKTQGYRYDLTQQGAFNCETWNPDESKTTYNNAGCDRWGCNDAGFYKWWMQNMPGFNNGIEYQGKKMRNWWEAMYDFNAFIDKGRSLFGESIFCSIPTVTVAPTSAPTSTPTSSPTPSPSPTSTPIPMPTSAVTPTPSDPVPDRSNLPVDSTPTSVFNGRQNALELIRSRQPRAREVKQKYISDLPVEEEPEKTVTQQKNEGMIGNIFNFITTINDKIADGIANLLIKAGFLKRQ